MKFFKYSIIALATACSLVACSDDDEYVVAPQSAGAYFPSTNPSTLNLTKDGTLFNVTVGRTDDSADATYNITSEADAAYFTIPASVTFPAGQKTANFAIAYNAEALGYDNAQTIKLALASNEATEYGKMEYTVQVIIPSPWESIGTGMYREVLIADLFGLDEMIYDVEIEQNSETPGLFRVVNPYRTPKWAYYDEADLDPATGTFYLYIDASNPDKVKIPLSDQGVNYGYGATSICDLNTYYALAGKEDKMNDAYYGKYDAEAKTISFESTIIVNLSEYGSLGVNENGNFRVYMPGVVLKDYSGDISYLGLFTSAETGETAAVVNISVGDDITSARVAMMETRNPADVFGAIADGSVEYTDFGPGANQTTNLTISGSGWYTVGIVGYDGEEQVMAEFTTFEVKLADYSDGNWEALGNAQFTDGWILPLYKVTASDYVYEVPIEKSLDDEGIYRLVSPYTQPGCPIVGYNSNTEVAYIVIDASDPQFVTIEPQYSSYTDEDGEIYIGESGWYFETKGYPRETIIANGYNSTMADGVIDIPVPLFGTSYTDFGYSADPVQAAKIVLPTDNGGESAAAPARKPTSAHKSLSSCVKPAIESGWRLRIPAMKF